MSKRNHRRRHELVQSLLDKPIVPEIHFARLPGGIPLRPRYRVWNSLAPDHSMVLWGHELRELQASVERVRRIIPEIAIEEQE